MGRLGQEDSVREVRQDEVVEAAQRRDQQFERIASLMIDTLDVANVVIGIFEGAENVVFYDHAGELEQERYTTSFCRYAAREESIRVWPNLLDDPEFESHEIVVESPHVRSVAAAPLSFGAEGAKGAVCAMADEPREWSDEELDLFDRFTSTIVDAVELRVASRRLDRANRRMEALFGAAPMGTVVFDAEGRVSRLNRFSRSIFGCDKGELPDGRLPYADAEDRRRFERRFDAVVEQGGLAEVEICISNVEGEDRICEVSLARVLHGPEHDTEVIAAVEDVTERRRREAKLRHSEHRFRRIFEEAGVGMGLVNPEQVILEANRALADMLGYEVDELEGMNLEELTHPDDFEDEVELVEELAETDRASYQMEKRYIRCDGSVMWGHLTASKIENEEGETDYMVGMVEDVTARKRAERKLKYRARHDFLTDLLNRDAFEESLREVLGRTTSGWAVMFVDLDDFKQVNDTLGHTAGDDVLKSVASRFARAFREEDVVARIGGDEFGVLLRSVDGEEEVDEVVGRFHDALDEPIVFEDESFELSASAGIVVGDEQFEEPDDVLRAADAAMYRAKQEARGSWIYWDGGGSGGE